GLPPILLQVGTRDILWSDSTRFSGSASAAGVEVTLEVEEGLIHVWHMFPDVPEAQNAVGSIGAFVNRYVSG
ncbi:MAG: alpha/beta hydrolase, partial [Pseudomonadales bacterium]|nr:alpha/beta hydrolase [Pseudomonadales bacterium]